jgi:alkylhydroperoxidase family enzyme
MAALVAKWNSRDFCVGAHGAVAAKEIERSLVDTALADYRAARISDRLKATLEFLEAMTLRPTELTSESAAAVFEAGVSAEALEDAIAVGAIFNIVTRYANALDFALPTANEFDRAASMLLKRGYAS